MANHVIDKSVDLKQKAEFSSGVVEGGAGDPSWAPGLLHLIIKILIKIYRFRIRTAAL